MATKAIEQDPKVTPVSVTLTQRKAAPWGYYFYCELRKIFRDPGVIVFNLGFPTLFFLIFANVYAKYETALLAQYTAYGAFTVTFSALSISIATERKLGWNRLLRTTPISAVLYLGSKFLVVMFTGIISIFILFATAAFIGRVQMPFSTWLTLFGSMLPGMIPFALAGIFLGFIGSAVSSQLISTVATLLLSFASGLFIPLQFMPNFMRTIAIALPTYHLGQVAWAAVNSTFSRDSYPVWFHLLVLCGFGIVFALLALWAYIRDENKNFA